MDIDPRTTVLSEQQWEAIYNHMMFERNSYSQNRILKRPYVKSVLKEFESQRHKRFKLKSKQVEEQIAFNVLRDPADLCDENGNINIKDLRDIPRRMRCTIDAIKCKQLYDKDGNVVGQTIELKFVPKHPQLELACKILGMINSDDRGSKSEVGSLISCLDQIYQNRLLSSDKKEVPYGLRELKETTDEDPIETEFIKLRDTNTQDENTTFLAENVTENNKKDTEDKLKDIVPDMPDLA